jgi:hypothetical protein
MTLSTSGTACTQRTRGKIPPSFSIVHVEPERMVIVMRNSGQSTGRTVVVPRKPPHENAVADRRRRGLQAAEAGARIGMPS